MHWIKSPAWDLTWVLNALWLSPLVLLLARGHADARATPVDVLFFAIAVPLWFGHRVSSAWLVYATSAYRPLLATQRRRLVLAPLAIATTCLAVLLAPERLLPLPIAERVVWLGVLNYLLVSHHFAAQHFGVLSLYRARAGRASDATLRRLDRWFAFVVGGGFVVVAEGLAGSIAFQDRWVDPLLGMAGSELFARSARDGGIGLVAILTALLVGAELRAERPSLPRLAYILGVAAMVLLAVLARDPFLFIVVWSVQHWSAALGLASLAAAGGAETAAHRRGLLAAVNRRSWAVVLVLAAVSVLVFPVMEVEAVTDEYAYADRLYGEAARWLRASPYVPVLLALGLATGFIHYLLDRSAFRFSSPAVRHAARALLAPRACAERANRGPRLASWPGGAHDA
jgi:hypothetical protein